MLICKNAIIVHSSKFLKYIFKDIVNYYINPHVSMDVTGHFPMSYRFQTYIFENLMKNQCVSLLCNINALWSLWPQIGFKARFAS